MRRYRKWVLTLGIVAAAPGVSMAGPFSWLRSGKSETAAKPAASPNHNQQIADEIKKSLAAAKLRGTGISIRVEGGTATLTGHMQDPADKERATQLTRRVPGVQRVDNRMIVVTPAATADKADGSRNPLARLFGGKENEEAAPAGGGVQQASATGLQRGRVTQVSGERGGSHNQQMAHSIADALQQAQLSGFDIRTDFANGTATLSGVVSSPDQRERAEQAARSVAGVENVVNHLQVLPAGPPPQMDPAAMYYAQQQMRMAAGAGVHPVNYQPNGAPVPAAPPAYGYPGAAPPHTVYNNPQVPPYAWPSYAQYPNSAQVSYPTQYSASAWPYIGPFYPYPQIPLGWRQVTLEWDDGYWMLDFEGGKTNKWWWFVNPKNW